MKKRIFFALLAGLALVSCKRITVMECDRWSSYSLYEYVNDLDGDCDIAWTLSRRIPTESDSIRIAAGASFVQKREGHHDSNGRLLLYDADEIRFSFSDGTQYNVKREEQPVFWHVCSQPHFIFQTLDDENGYRNEYHYFLSDIHALAVKP